MEEVLVMSLLAGLAIVLGGLLTFIMDKLSSKLLAAILGFSAGIMIFISIFKFIPSSWNNNTPLVTILGLGMGITLVWLLDIFIPHHCLHRSHSENNGSSNNDGQLIKIGLVIGSGVALHNLVEGLAVGAGHFAEEHLGIYIALALALHNLPIGVAIATPLKLGRLNNINILLITTLVGLFTPLGALISLYLYKISEAFISFGLALSAGLMLNIILRELIPEAYEYNKGFASLGLILGIILLKLLH
ncbi:MULTISPECIES: ZIP family metal transporter [unclassified Candidatus Frackibacter]|uniref:ZIP family metal transporter n=1 Tax=unclassified Candidatus Frackibacter TaxID=2648818 RepID=UPI00088725A5|nr:MULTISPECIES: ZIP family metal transporter [unclassified Candidatus Frackibacter]SDC80975.1 zinc transporter, ZIP family [Candidatus Frackibacter sp. WG11]SEM93401.1 zinc transporter, ZIP family [Candidatus Frackibacter sp. WG12]SFM02481.1 zinc transporter, ZIP family [Candidatus Frackibacter sp. WG13]